MGSLIEKNGFSTRITVILIALERKKSGDISICQHLAVGASQC